MDENQAELLRLIYTRIGMMMEDGSIIAIELGAPGSDFEGGKFAELRRLVNAIAALMGAADAINE